MKRRQHVGKKRAKVRSRRKSRRDTVKGLAREAHLRGETMAVELEISPEERRIRNIEERLDDHDRAIRDLMAMSERGIFAEVMSATKPEKKAPRLERGTQITQDAVVSDLDGELWMVRPSVGYMGRVS